MPLKNAGNLKKFLNVGNLNHCCWAVSMVDVYKMFHFIFLKSPWWAKHYTRCSTGFILCPTGVEKLVGEIILNPSNSPRNGMSYYNVHSLCAIIQLKKKSITFGESQGKLHRRSALKLDLKKKKKGRQEKRPTGMEMRTNPWRQRQSGSFITWSHPVSPAFALVHWPLSPPH